MDNFEGVDRLFFELASEGRLGILFELQTNDLKIQEIARKLDLTHTEAFRQLQRLRTALLIEKHPDSSYALTQNGKLALELTDSFKFVSKSKKILMTRDIQRLPYLFKNSIGELSSAILSTDTNEMIDNAERLIVGAEKFLWIMAQRPLGNLNLKAIETGNKGVSVKLIVDEANTKFFENTPRIKGFEKRVVPVVPAIMLISDKAAGINLPSLDNRGDSAVFYGTDQRVLRWASDLFLYFWQQGKQYS
jgi:predicted transcriptional regulator